METPQAKQDNALGIRHGFAHGLAWHNFRMFNLHVDGVSTGYPSWSWASRTQSQTKFKYFSHFEPYWYGLARRTRLNICYCAEISVEPADMTTETIDEFLAPFIASQHDKAIVEDLRYLHIKSPIARWSSKNHMFDERMGYADLTVSAGDRAALLVRL